MGQYLGQGMKYGEAKKTKMPNETIEGAVLAKEIAEKIKSDFDIKTGYHFDSRPGLLNFSIVGRNASKTERKKYVKYDTSTNERELISNKFNKLFSKKFNIVSQVAGETGLDIIKIGTDKAQILKDFTFQDELIFFGDNIQSGGNDYGIAQVIEYGPYDRTEVHHVKNWKETWKILKKYDIHERNSKR